MELIYVLLRTIFAALVFFESSFGKYLFVPMEKRINATGTLKQDWCTEEHVFKSITGVTLYKCGEECMRRSRCASVLYYTGMRICRLRNETNVTPASTDGLRKICISSDISTWDFSVIGNCGTRPCDVKSRCFLNQYFIDRCEITECLDLPDAPNSHVASSVYDVGSTNAYICDKPYARVGHSYTVECKANGEWSTSTFGCYPRCPFPNFQNADMEVTSPHVYVVNETVGYTCKNGYRHPDGAEKGRILCDVNGTWSEPKCVLQ